MACRWCGQTSVRPTARYCSACAAPLVEGIPLAIESGVALGNYVSGTCMRGRYEIRKLLGTGGMGTVYGAIDYNVPGRRVAIKELDLQRSANRKEQEAALRMFRDEAETLAHLDHPHIPKISDQFTEAGRYYQVLDFVDGSTLSEILKKQTVPEDQAVAWTRQMCDALQYLHNQRPAVIFRDLKPANVMVDRSGHVKIIDFGIARRFKVGQGSDTVIIGTPGYAPPEQYGSGQTDVRSDIYSLCATLYAMVTGYDVSASPFNLPPIRQFAPMLSQRTEQVINRGLELNPKDRWQSVQEMTVNLVGQQVGAGSAAPGERRVPAGDRSGSVTQRLANTIRLMTAEWSSAQIAAALVVLTTISAVATWFLTPILSTYQLFWNNVDMSAIVAALAFAGIRKKWIAGTAQAIVTAVGGVITQQQMRGAVYAQTTTALALGCAIVSGILVVIWLHFIPQVRGQGSDAWKREWAWVAVLAIPVTMLVRLPYGAAYAAQIGVVISSLVLGGLGWFIGDLIQETFFRQKFKVERGGHV